MRARKGTLDFKMKNIYEIQNLSKSYKKAAKPANDRISFSIPEGELVVFVGPNGAGKTTLVRQMVGLLSPDSGRIYLAGQDIASHPEVVGQSVSYLPQQGFGLSLTHLTVYEAVYYVGRLRQLSDSRAAERTEELIERFSLKADKNKTMRYLSGGQRRLAALCSAFVAESPVIFLDEPTNDLDPQARRQVWEYLQEIKEKKNTTVIVVTHNVLEADKVADRIAFIGGGKLLAYEPLPELKSRLQGLTVDIWSAQPIQNGLAQGLASWPSVTSGDGRGWKLSADSETLPSLIGLLQKHSESEAVHWTIRMPTLEDIYFKLAKTQEVKP